MSLTRWYAETYSGAVTATLGAPRTGKTRLVQAADSEGAFPRRLVVDPYARRDRRERAQRRPVSPWPGMLISVRDLCAHPDVLDRPNLRLVVALDSRTEQDRGRDFSRVLELAWHTGDLDIIAEEIGLYGRAAVEWVMQVASGSGHAGIRLHTICQSVGRIPIDARRHFSHVAALAQGEESDLDALRKRCGRAFAAAVSRLRKGDPPVTWQLGEERWLPQKEPSCPLPRTSSISASVSSPASSSPRS